MEQIMDIVHELVEAETQLAEIKTKNKLQTQQKIYRKLSDLDIVLNRIECHANATRKYTKLQTSLIYHLVKAQCGYNEKGVDDWWKEYCQITD